MDRDARTLPPKEARVLHGPHAQRVKNVFSSSEDPTVRMATELGCQCRSIITKISP
jgi:hypothetical protein